MKNKVLFIIVISAAATVAVALVLARVMSASVNLVDTVCSVIVSFVVCCSFIALLKLVKGHSDEAKHKKLDICTYILIPVICMIVSGLVMSHSTNVDGNHTAFDILLALSVLASIIISLLYLYTRQGQSAGKIGLKTSALFNGLNLILLSAVATCFTLPDVERLMRRVLVFAGICIAWFIIGIFGFWAIRANAEKHHLVK